MHAKPTLRWPSVLCLTMLAAALSTGLLAQPAHADNDKKTAKFHSLDKNKDGILTADEFRSGAEDHEQQVKRDTRFKKLDVNHDGKLTPTEFAGTGKSEKEKSGSGKSANSEKEKAGSAKGSTKGGKKSGPSEDEDEDEG